MAYSIMAAHLCNADSIVVSTDDEEIAEIAVEYGAKILMRPDKYATDSSSDFGFLKHYFENYDCNEVALLRPTTPFRDPKYMLNVINIYFKNADKMTGLRTAEEMNQPAYKQLKIKDNYFEQLFDSFEGVKDYSNLPRQKFPITYSPNGHIDIVKREMIDNGSVFGDKIYACVGKKMVDIDDFHDLMIGRLVVGSEVDHLSNLIRKE